MKIKVLTWLFFILCFALSTSTLEKNFTQEQVAVELSVHLLQGSDVQGLNEIISKDGDRRGDGRGKEVIHVGTFEKAKAVYGGDGGGKEVIHGGTFEKAKVVYGGADKRRQPRNKGKSGAASLLRRPSSFFSTTLIEMGIGLILAFILFF